MGSFSIWHWIIVLVVVLLLFGRGKIPELMGDLAKGINSFKKGLKEEEKDAASAKTIEQKASESVSPAKDQSAAG